MWKDRRRPWCSDRVSVVPVAARGAVGVQPVLHVGLLGPLVQRLHAEQMLLWRDAESPEGDTWEER